MLNIFYSWQSDSPSKTNRNFIEKVIDNAIKELNKKDCFIACLDRDTKGETGSPNISESVFRKINQSKFFVCDISLINCGVPNSNVLIELGYAIHVLGWNKIICLFNSKSGNVEDLPFDLNHNRVTVYDSDQPNEMKRLSNIISKTVLTMFKHGELYNPIEDHIKRKIDKIVFGIIKNIVGMFYLGEDIDYSSAIEKLRSYNNDEFVEVLKSKQFLGYFFKYDYSHDIENLEIILNQLLSSDYFMFSWRESVINFINWMEGWVNICDYVHHSPGLLNVVGDSEYKIQLMHYINPENPLRSALLLKRLSEDKYVVVAGGFIGNTEYAEKFVSINGLYHRDLIGVLRQFFKYLDIWMENSGYEIIVEGVFAQHTLANVTGMKFTIKKDQIV